MIVIGIETATPQTSVAVGSDEGILAQMAVSSSRPSHESVVPALEQVLKWSGIPLSSVAGIAVGVGPGLFTGLRVGVETGKTLAQVLGLPVVAMSSLDVLAFGVRYTRRVIGAAIDARRGEVFFGLYRPAPGGVTRVSEFMVGTPEHLGAELEALGEEALLVGDGALRYRRDLERLESQVEFAASSLAYPHAAALVELSIPRFHREEFDKPLNVVPVYLRKSDAEIAWDRRARAG